MRILAVHSLLIFARTLRRWPAIWRYALATLFVLAAFGLRVLLSHGLGTFPFLLFIPAVMLSALLLDHGTGIYATLLSTLLAAYSILPSLVSFAVPRRDVVACVLFLLICCALASVIELLRKMVDQLDAAEQAKHTLLVEANHRFKNNLQIIVSLLTMQGRHDTSADTVTALAQAAERVQVIARLHDRFHASDHGGVVAMKDYLEGLGADLGDSLRGERPIAVRVTADDAEIALDRAVQIGLVINELVTNALKYAFPEGRGGAIDVRFNVADDSAEILVRDDGVGCPEASVPGLGTRLVSLLARQLGGEMTRTACKPGCLVRLQVPLKV